MTLCGRSAPGAAADSPRCPSGNSQREAPWPLGTGAHAASARERHGLPPARQHHGHRPRTWLDRYVAGAQDCPLITLDRQLADAAKDLVTVESIEALH
jgi:hypothetical protein